MANDRIVGVGPIFGEVLKRVRLKKELSQEALAFEAGVDRTFVSQIERGLKQPTITTLIGLGMALGVSAADLVRETEREYHRMQT
ncbi:MAG: helix-turn-helix transcriptional regulator [Ramlibacter sp.]|nr:helix-turn-helix transcriptional regulator [Ramlibacter sp.]